MENKMRQNAIMLAKDQPAPTAGAQVDAQPLRVAGVDKRLNFIGLCQPGGIAPD